MVTNVGGVKELIDQVQNLKPGEVSKEKLHLIRANQQNILDF
jgi:hypothetical protein